MPVQISEIEQWLERKASLFPKCKIILDKDQLVGTEQKFLKKGYEVSRFQYRGGTNNFRLAENLRSLISNKKIRFTATCGLHNDGSSLADELKKVIIKKKSYGYRIDHNSDEHDDRVIVVGMAALDAIAESPSLPVAQRRAHPTLDTDITLNSPIGGGFGNRELFRNRGLFGLK